jgi:23S rRNA (uracil1939-C5)-methyltransferase
MMRKNNYGQEIEITIDALGFEGISIGRIDGHVHFVKGALPGERVRARIVGKKKKHIIAETIEVLSASQERVAPPCKHFGICGGCSWQHLLYEQQASWKRQHVVDCFDRLARIDVGSVHQTMSAVVPYGYRNKMEFSFGASAWLSREEIESSSVFVRDFALGLHVPGRFDKVRNITSCMLQSEVANRVLEHTHACRLQHVVPAYHQRDHVGFLRHLVLRTSAATDQVMAILITTTPSSESEHAFIQQWMSVHQNLPDQSSVIHAINDTWSPVAVGTIASSVGPGYLDELSDGIWYRVSPFSFFQTNTIQLPRLVDKAMEGAAITPDSVVWDLYCGTGTLTLPAAKRAKHVIGVELVESSIADAKANADRNQIANVEFHVADLHHASAIDLLRGFTAPDIVIVDPPRNGLHEQVAAHILAIAPEQVLYVSCNPATLARDCAILNEKYDIDEVTPVDMFPQTYHVEAVAVLRRR